NTEAAHRPNRRVELLFTTSAALPAQAPVPDTWTLHPPGRTEPAWCLGPGDPAKRCAFSKRTPPPEPPRLLIQPAEPGTVEAAGRILREVERADGTVEQVPAANESFVLITAAGEYRAGEAGSGLPTPAKTGADGGFSFPGKPRGLYALEIQRGVIARLLDAPGAAALGPTVCKALAADGAKLDVLILRDPVLREIRLPVIVHLMTALHPTTRVVRTCVDDSKSVPTTHEQRTARDEAAVRTMLTGANAIWGRARVRFEVRDVVREAFATPGRDACHVTEDERNNVVVDAATPNAVNLFFFGSVDVLKEGGVTLRGGLLDGAGTQVRELVAISIADVVLRQLLPPIPPSRHTPTPREAEVILAHELGHWLSLDHVTGLDSTPPNRNRLMLPELGDEHRRLLDTEVTQVRGSSDAAKECVPLALRVAGAVRYGGPHGHRFIAIRDAAAPAVTVDAVLPPHLAASGLTMTGGAPGASPTQRTVGRGTGGRTEVIAKFAAAGGRPMETYAAVQVVDFDVAVDGARRLGGGGGTTFVAVRSATGKVTVRADVTPAPDVVPFDMVTWSAGDETDDPLRRTLSLATAGTTTVSVTVAGVTKTVTLQVSELALNVTGAQRTGPDQFATAQDETGDVSVEAVLTPPVPEDAGLVDWTGGQPGPGPRFRLVSKQAVQVTTVTATVGAPAPAAPAGPAPAALAPAPAPAPVPPAGGGSVSATITVMSFELDVPGATRLDGPTGKRFVALPAGTPLTVVANVSPLPNPLPPGFITWTGAVQNPAQPLQATVQRPGKNTVTVTASIGGSTRSITLFIVTFRLDVQGATRVTTPAGNDFVTVLDTAAGSDVNVGAVIDPLPNPVPSNLVTWSSSDGTATPAGPLARLVPRAPKRIVTVTGTVAGQAQSERIFVSEFTLKVTGAEEIPPVGSGEFISVAAPGTSAVVAAEVDPAPTPTPPDLVVWGGAPATPDGLLARKVAKDAPGPAVRLQATMGGTTRAAAINVVEFTIAVADATAVPANGTALFALAQAGAAPLVAEARITPAPAVPLPADVVVMTGGGEVPGNPRQRTVPRTAPSAATGVQVQAASALLGVTRTVTVTVVSFSITGVQGATQIGARSSTLFATTTGAGDVTVTGALVPVLNPLPAG
ncbi:MAG TPA: hypothetical protein VFT45_03585, partial [Longimicrobium sp.]|nr:hypothetical protein [Longimicrobium sp.]